MALTNWLNAGEWATAYWFGIREANENGKECPDLGTQLRLGIGAMVKAGYSFKGIKADEEGNYEKVEMQSDCPANVLADMLIGEFSPMQQAEIAIDWCKKNLPSVDMGWLEVPVSEAKKNLQTT